jgi:methanogenic corrinoid protein MtbC1
VKDRIISLSQAEAQQEKIVNELIQYMIELDMDQLENVLDNFIGVRGIDKTITQIIFPFLDRIGILWLTNHIQPTQEHLVSNIIRQKLIVGIQGAVSHVFVDKTVLLFLPEGEHHELGLLYIYYQLKCRGVKVLYMGSNTPLIDIEFVCKCKKPDHLYTHLTCITENFNLEKFLSKLRHHIPDISITISGKLAQAHIHRIPPNVHLKRSLREVLEYISSL